METPFPCVLRRCDLAIYHMHCDVLGRSKGRSAVAAAAYRSCTKIKDLDTGKTHDFRRKKGLLHEEIFTPLSCPEWAEDREKLWNEVEKKENRKNSQFAKSFDIALYPELSLLENKLILRYWIQQNITSKHLVADVAIHDGHDGNKNIHAHVLVTTRKMNRQGWAEKAFPKLKDEHEWLEKCRESWAEWSNMRLEKFRKSVSSETLKAQGIRREPTKHKGPYRTALERKNARLQTLQNTPKSPEISPQRAPKRPSRQESWEW